MFFRLAMWCLGVLIAITSFHAYGTEWEIGKPHLAKTVVCLEESDGVSILDAHQNEGVAAEAWLLAEWLMNACPWLYVIGGNHDLWSGAGDPLKWIAAQGGQPYEPHGVRLELQFPNGKKVRINARHDFKGHSMWNTTHGVAKAAQMGWRDHILTCGHTHVSGYQVLKDPSSGLISHAIRAASYKVYDSYAEEKGLPDQNIFMCPVTIIRPEFDDDDPRLITTFFEPYTAAEFLTYLRKNPQ